MKYFGHYQIHPSNITLKPNPLDHLPFPISLNVRPTPIAHPRNICPSTLPSMASGIPSKELDIPALKTALYDACVSFSKEVFNQSVLFGLGVIPDGDLNTLLTVTQGLVDEKLFKVVHSEGLGWKLRSREEAKKLGAPFYDIVQ